MLHLVDDLWRDLDRLAHIGRDCNLSRGATIELGARRGESGAPWIGDRVYIGPGVRVTGPVRIGNDSCCARGRRSATCRRARACASR
jgi:acetyltransferase-like isoleucine patch superfamily enzyme